VAFYRLVMALHLAWTRGESPSRGDIAVAAVALVAVQIEVWGFWVVSEQGPKPLAAVFGLITAVALAWCRHRPVAVLAVVLGVHLTWTLVAVPQGFLVPFLILLVAVFNLAMRVPIAAAVGGLVAAVAAEVLFVVRTTNDFADYMFILAFVAGAWGAGRAVRSRQQRADELFARTVRLEVEKEEQARRARDEERARIAREMHDVISHSVSVMVVQASAAERVLSQDPAAAQAALRAVQEVGREARLELRRMLGLMRSPVGDDLDPQPDLTQLPALLDQLRGAGLEIDLEVSGTVPTLPPGVGLTAYRVVQEALTNALAHGADKHARVCLDYGTDVVSIAVANPAGARDEPSGGHGLVGMGERVRLYGGTLDHGRDPDGCFRLHVRLPTPGAAS
jgi:signal transduction histidine kinase